MSNSQDQADDELIAILDVPRCWVFPLHPEILAQSFREALLRTQEAIANGIQPGPIVTLPPEYEVTAEQMVRILGKIDG